MLPVWDDSYSVHNKRIDGQHKKLFELAGYAYVCADRKISRTEIKQLLGGFFNYMREHFQDEEEYMRSIGYPQLKRHQAIHQEIVQGLSEVVQTTSNTNELKEKLGIIAKNWLLQHILKEDMLIEQYRIQKDQETKEDISTQESQNQKNKIQRFQYTCSCPDKKHTVTEEVHKKISSNATQLRCKVCKQPICFQQKIIS